MSGKANTEEAVRKSFFQQAEWCVKLGSPLMGQLANCLGRCLDTNTKTGNRILTWQGDPSANGDAVALRLSGVLHALVRRGAAPDLAPFYEADAILENNALAEVLIKTIKANDPEIMEWLDFAPQTNEVRRAAVIYPGLAKISDITGLPIALYELGASGGLNLQMNSFAYEIAETIYGAKNSAVRLVPEWTGFRPKPAAVNVVSRRGCDLNPLSVERAEDREKLIAYLWPDQPERITRTQAAIDIACQDPPQLDRMDAASWVEKILENGLKSGVAHVFYHTIAWQYFPQETKDRITNAMESAGKVASVENPLFWLSFEFSGGENPELAMREWPGGGKVLLAKAPPHVHSIEWLLSD
ncbi:MAG: DUF2332 domain-containing protein [Pseudomonadota bacterium]